MVREGHGGTVVEVRVIPRAATSALAGVLGVPKRALSIVHGDTSRRKRVLVTGLRPDQVAARLTSTP